MPGNKKGQFSLGDIDQSQAQPPPPGSNTQNGQAPGITGQFSFADVAPTQDTPQNANQPQNQPPNSVGGGFFRRAVDTIKGGITSGLPVPSMDDIHAVAKDPTFINKFRLFLHSTPGLAPLSRMVEGEAGSVKQAGAQAKQQAQKASAAPFNPGDRVTKPLAYARAGVTALSALDPFATGSVTNVNSLEDQGRGREAAGQGFFDAVALGTGPAAGKITRGIFGKTPLGDTVNTPRGSTSAESATPAELQQYAADNNIPATTAQLTEHNAPRHLQSTGERALAGGTAIRKQVNAAQAAIADHVDNLADQMSPSSQTPNTAASGAKLQEGIQQALDREKQTAESNYNAIDGKAKGMGVNMKPVKQLADTMATDSKFIRENAKTLDPKRGSALLKTLSDLPDKASFTDAQKLRSALLDEARHPDNVLSEQAQGWIKRLTGAVDDTMMDSAQKIPGLEKDFRAANAHWEGLQNDFNSPRSPLFQALKEPIPEKVPQKFLNKGQTGGSPTTIQMLDRYGIDKGPLKRELLSDLQQQDFKMQKKSLGGYDDGFLRALYSPGELDHVYKTGALARSVAKDVNPSGTAGTSEAIAQVRNPLRIVPAGAAAKLTLSTRFNSYLMRGPAASQRVGATSQAVTRGTLAGSFANASNQARKQQDQQ